MRELDLLHHVYAASRKAPGVEIGPGDDMALLRLSGRRLLAAVDQIVDGRHVRLDRTPLELVGRKAITRCLSDVAAMAGRPVAALVAVTLPPDFGAGRATRLFDAMRETGDAYGCPLVGGDIAFHAGGDAPLVCSVTVLAEPIDAAPRTRGAARPGDAVYVTGALGGSLDADGGGRHLTFDPRLAEASDLAAALGDRLHAMIDLSDGLGRDAGHVAVASGVTIEIDAARLPCRPPADWRRAASDGEDYELLFTASAPPPDVVGAGIPITRIGLVTARSAADAPPVIVLDGDDRIAAHELGWQHES